MWSFPLPARDPKYTQYTGLCRSGRAVVGPLGLRLGHLEKSPGFFGDLTP
jgi:hypothetical protein